MKKLSSTTMLQLCYVITILMAVCLFISCTATEKLKPHEHKDGDAYCVYKVTKAPDKADFKKDDIICIYCKDQSVRCASTKTVEINEQKYDLVSNGATCESCPGNNTFEKE